MFDSLSEKLRQHLNFLDRNTIIIGAAVAIGSMALAGGGFFYSPYITINNIKNATTNRNSDALSQEINFAELRTSFKENIKAQVVKQLGEANDTRSPKMTISTIEKTVSLMVDSLITPEGIEKLMLDKVPEAKIDLSNLERDLARSEIAMGYESFDRFVVRIIDKVDRAKDVSLILKRDGIAWKLAGIDISQT
ncbi:DUF2939 domain-containing protein [Chamaesiphon sp.]|uniref:DUF2939 domain-containing protein n=1 Tax=Chamaesiphon sp. TaxID=2814140 RepID=UPI0035947466